MMNVTYGDSVTMPCKAVGIPQPIVSWRKGATIIEYGDYGYEFGFDGSLTIDSSVVREY